MNELKVKNGLIVEGPERITGSLYVSQGISASFGLHGTASWARHALTSSWAVSASHALYADNARSSSYATNASWATNALTASSVTGLSFDTTSSISSTPTNVITQRDTSSFISVNYQYAAHSSSNMRVGNIFGGWLPGGSTVTYAEFVTTDIGNTSEMSMSIALTGSKVQLISNAPSLFWTVKTLATYL